MNRWLLATLFLAAGAGAATARGEAPRAVVDAPAAVAPGSVIFLDGRRSEAAPGRPLRWKLLEPAVADATAPLLTFDADGRDDVVAVLADAQAGRVYRFALVAVGPADAAGVPDVDVALCEVAVGEAPAPSPSPTPDPSPPPAPSPAPSPSPSPTPTPDPDAGALGLAGVARDAAARVAQPAPHRAAVARALAGAYRAIGSRTAAGAFATPDEMLAANRDCVRAVLHANLDAWKPALDAIKARLDTLVAAGTLKDLPDWSAAWLEVADGLDRAAAVTTTTTTTTVATKGAP